MNKISNIIKAIILGGLCSATFSFVLPHFISSAPVNDHWTYSIYFHSALAIALGVLMIIFPGPKTMAANLLSISLGRLLACAIAFMIYRQNFPQLQKWFMLHFMVHYVFFTFFEIIFLLKIATHKISNK